MVLLSLKNKFLSEASPITKERFIKRARLDRLRQDLKADAKSIPSYFLEPTFIGNKM